VILAIYFARIERGSPQLLKINFHHLYYFYIIAEERQVARAAHRLRIGQPALSTQLKQFEEFLGYRLFDRKRGQALSLTRHGEILHRYAQEIFRLSDEMLAAAQGVKSDQTLYLRVGALDWLPKHEVSDVICNVLRRFDCFVSVYEDTANHLISDLAAHRFDLVITNAPPPHSEQHHFRAHRIAHLPVVFYGAPKFARLRQGFPGSLAGQPVILPTPHGRTRHIVDDYFRSHGIEVNLIGEAQDGELLRRAVLTGQGLVPLSPSTIEAELDRKEVVAIGELKHVFEDVWLVSTPRLLEHPVVSYLMEDFKTSAAA
jgi:LysR family transcriptional activator of nhaA